MGSTAPAITELDDPPITVVGRNAKERGYSFEQGIRDNYGSELNKPTLVPGVGKVDDVVGRIAYEAKYADDFDSSIRNPNFNLPFEHTAVSDVVNQAILLLKAEKFDEIHYYTNDLQFERTYNELLFKKGLMNIRFYVVWSSK